jgi:hypothetical protein
LGERGFEDLVPSRCGTGTLPSETDQAKDPDDSDILGNHGNVLYGVRCRGAATPPDSIPEINPGPWTCAQTATQKRVILASLILESEQHIRIVSPDEDEIEDSINDLFHLGLRSSLIQIHSRY